MTFNEVLLNATEIKKLIINRSFEFNIPLKYICSEVGIEYRAFLDSYINAPVNPSGITEDQFKEILGILGVSLRYQLVIDKNIDMEKRSKELEEKYRLKAEKRRQSRNEYGK
jgi:hypothetical protein